MLFLGDNPGPFYTESTHKLRPKAEFCYYAHQGTIRAKGSWDNVDILDFWVFLCYVKAFFEMPNRAYLW